MIVKLHDWRTLSYGKLVNPFVDTKDIDGAWQPDVYFVVYQ